uniref:trans-sulfuration enzyme family protein n=1 Tax=Bordetella sputigena TaxID=1416810 RepID=UPI0039F124E2
MEKAALYPADMHDRLKSMPEFMGFAVPIHRASTIKFNTVEDFTNRRSRLFDGFSYGLYGTPTVRYMEEEIAKLEGGKYCLSTPSGLSAVNLPMLALLKGGDHILVAQNAYGTTREFCNTFLSRLGIQHTIIPADATTIQPWLTPSTRLVILESPGSYTMEIQDMEKIAHEAHEHGALVSIDNAWGLGLTKPFKHGIDIVCNALSKYASGHSDVCMGSVTVNDRELYERLKTASFMLGEGVSSDDASLVLRGLQTFDVRVAEHAKRALTVADWLKKQPTVARVICPSHPEDSQHNRFSQYFSGGNGLLSVILKKTADSSVIEMVEGFKMFKIGASWGGTHSLVAPIRANTFPWLDEEERGNWLLRLHIGLEPFDFLQRDLEDGFAALSARQRA